MKKLFVLFLLVSLVPFTLGCWGSDSDDPAVTYQNVLVNQKLPAGSFAANALEAKNFINLTYVLTINGKDEIFYYKSHKAEGNEIVFTFYKPVASTSFTSYVDQIKSQPVTSAVIKYGTTTIATAPAFNMPAAFEAEKEVVLTATINSVDLTNIPAADKVATYSVDSVSYVPTQGTEVVIGQDSAATYNVNSTTPTFKVAFKLETAESLPESLTGVTFKVLVRNEDTKAEFTLTTTDGLTIARGTDGKSVTIAINATNSLGKNLVVGTKYSVTITTTSLQVGTKRLVLPGAYYFTVTQ